MSNYVPYHIHSQLSNGITNIDSITDFHDYVDAAKELGIKAFAFAEHGNIFNWVKKKEYIESCGMKYIHAIEAYLTEDDGSRKLYSAVDELASAMVKKEIRKTFEEYYFNETSGWYIAKSEEDEKEFAFDISTLKVERLIKTKDNYHCVLIAKNHDGVRELNRIISKSFDRSDFHYYYAPRITLDELFSTSDNIIVTTACLGSAMNRGTVSAKERMLSFLAQNKHRCFLEIQHHNCADQIEYNKMLYALSKEIGVPLIAGTDTHALNEQHMEGRSMLQKAKSIHFADEDAWDLIFKSYDDLVAAYKKQKALPMNVVLEAIENTNVMADMVEEFRLDYGTKYPKIYEDPISTYKSKINKAFINHPYIRKRYKPEEINPVIREEVEVYEKTKSIDFMLLQTYLREWEKLNDVFCGYGRGSVSGSEVAYVLGITQMDSKKFGLNFFRFMNPSRVTNADIDTDYGSKDREKVKRFILKDHMNLPNIRASEIITFNTIALKGAIKDIGRALGMDLEETQDISDSAYIDNETKQWTVSDSIRKKYPKLFKYVDIVNGTVVSIGSHPSGILVSDLNIDEEVGLCSLSTSEYPVSQLNMKELDALMYVKLDILGLDNVSVINETCKMAGIERLTPDNTDLDDEKVWNDIRDDTTLIFQWESESAQAFLKQFMSDETINIAKENNENFSYIKWFSFGNGLIRPGCASFRDSVAKGEILTTGFKELDSFLSVTSGRITMQEDIMRFLVLFCGYSDAESDTVRRGIAKKYGTEKFIDEIHDRFISYSHEKYNVEIDLLEEIFPPIKQGILDATRYAFSWNHSDAYSCIGYICGYLRYYYPLEFVTAALNTFEDKEDKSIAIIEYAKKRGIKISPIKFRHSVAQYNLDKAGNQVFKGISSIKYMNEIVANEMYELRNNTYNSFIDLLIDLQNKTSLNSRQLQILIELDFFEEFGDCNKLLETVRLFDELYGKKQMKKEKCEKLGIPEEVVLRHCSKATEKTFMELDLAGLLTELCGNIKCKPRKLKDRVAAQVEHLGYVDIADPSYDRMLAILDVDTKYAPKIKAHSLKNGSTLDIKIDRRTFNKLKVAKGDIILVRNQNIKPKQKKNAEGEWEPVPGTKEIWLTDYRKVDSL